MEKLGLDGVGLDRVGAGVGGYGGYRGSEVRINIRREPNHLVVLRGKLNRSSLEFVHHHVRPVSESV